MIEQRALAHELTVEQIALAHELTVEIAARARIWMTRRLAADTDRAAVVAIAIAALEANVHAARTAARATGVDVP